MAWQPKTLINVEWKSHSIRNPIHKFIHWNDWVILKWIPPPTLSKFGLELVRNIQSLSSCKLLYSIQVELNRKCDDISFQLYKKLVGHIWNWTELIWELATDKRPIKSDLPAAFKQQVRGNNQFSKWFSGNSAFNLSFFRQNKQQKPNLPPKRSRFPAKTSLIDVDVDLTCRIEQSFSLAVRRFVSKPNNNRLKFQIDCYGPIAIPSATENAAEIKNRENTFR